MVTTPLKSPDAIRLLNEYVDARSRIEDKELCSLTWSDE